MFGILENASLSYWSKATSTVIQNVIHNRQNTLDSTSRVFQLYVDLPRPPLWSGGQSSWLQIRRPGFNSRHYQKKKCSGVWNGVHSAS
jgi:hypothetical protein